MRRIQRPGQILRPARLLARQLGHYLTSGLPACPLSASRALAAAALARNLGAFLSRLGETDGDSLLAALHSLAASARFEGSFFAPAHRALDALRCRFAVSPTTRRFSCRHSSPPLTVCRVSIWTGWRMLCREKLHRAFAHSLFLEPALRDLRAFLQHTCMT